MQKDSNCFYIDKHFNYLESFGFHPAM